MPFPQDWVTRFAKVSWATNKLQVGAVMQFGVFGQAGSGDITINIGARSFSNHYEQEAGAPSAAAVEVHTPEDEDIRSYVPGTGPITVNVTAGYTSTIDVSTIDVSVLKLPAGTVTYNYHDDGPFPSYDITFQIDRRTGELIP